MCDATACVHSTGPHIGLAVREQRQEEGERQGVKKEKCRGRRRGKSQLVVELVLVQGMMRRNLFGLFLAEAAAAAVA